MNKKLLMFFLIISPMSHALDFDALENAKPSKASVSVDFSDANDAAEKKHEKVIEKQKKSINDFMSKINEGRGNYVMVDFDTTCGLLPTCTDHKLSITGSPGRYSSNNDRSGAIHKGYKGQIAGEYQFVGSFKYNGSWRSCSGSFRLSGSESNYNIRVYGNGCNDAGSRGY